MRNEDVFTKMYRRHARRRAALEERTCEQALQSGRYGAMILEFDDHSAVGLVHPSVPYGTMQIHKWGEHVQGVLGETISAAILEKRNAA